MILLMLLVTLSESVELSTPKSTQLSVYSVQRVMEINSKQCGIWLFFSGLAPINSKLPSHSSSQVLTGVDDPIYAILMNGLRFLTKSPSLCCP